MSVNGVVLYPFIERFKEIDYEVLYKMWNTGSRRCKRLS